MPNDKDEIGVHLGKALGIIDEKGDCVFVPSETELQDIERGFAALVRFCRAANKATGRYSNA